MPSRLFKPTFLLLGSLLLTPAFAGEQLRCEMNQGGRDLVLEARPDPDPYQRHTQDVFGRFLVKAVVNGRAGHIDYVKLYVFAQGDEPTLLQQASYGRPILTAVPAGQPFTGEQRIYTTGWEYELIYRCRLTEDKP